MIRKSLLSIAAVLMTLCLFGGTTALLTPQPGAVLHQIA